MTTLGIPDELPTFQDTRVLKASDLNLLRMAVAVCDAASQRPVPVPPDSYEEQRGEQFNPYGRFSGGIVYQSGMEDLIFAYGCTGSAANDLIELLINGVTITSQALIDGSNQTLIADITSGYTDGEVLEIDVQLRNAVTPSRQFLTVLVTIEDAYAIPVPLPFTYPTAPTFTTPQDSTDLNTLRNSVQYCLNVVRSRIEPLFTSIQRARVPRSGATDISWRGFIAPTTTLTDVQAIIVVDVPAYADTVPTDEIELYLDNTLIDDVTVDSNTPGTAFITLAGAIPAVVSATVPVRVRVVRTAGTDASEPLRFTLAMVEAYRPTISTLSPALPAPLVGGDDYSDTALVDWLNDLSASTEALYDRLTADAWLWTRQRIFRRGYYFPYSAQEGTWWLSRFVPVVLARYGGRLITRGSGVSLGYLTASYGQDNEVGVTEILQEYREQLNDNSGVATVTTDLRLINGLVEGVPYHVLGINLSYAGEGVD